MGPNPDMRGDCMRWHTYKTYQTDEWKLDEPESLELIRRQGISYGRAARYLRNPEDARSAIERKARSMTYVIDGPETFIVAAMAAYYGAG